MRAPRSKPDAELLEDKGAILATVHEWLKHDDPNLRKIAQSLLDELKKSNQAQSIESYSVLLPEGKPRESARKMAKQFYQQRGIANSTLQGEDAKQTENDLNHCNECGSLLTEPRQFNLMFKTYVGPVEDPDSVAYLRPETAQAIFAQFKSVLEVSRQKVPFGICQIGNRKFGLGLGSLAQLLGRTAGQLVPKHRSATQFAGRILAEAGGTRALRASHRGHPLQIPLQQTRRERRVDGRRVGRHRRPQRFRPFSAPAFLRQTDGRVRRRVEGRLGEAR